MKHYIGLDAHSTTCTFAVVNWKGRVLVQIGSSLDDAVTQRFSHSLALLFNTRVYVHRPCLLTQRPL